MPLPAVSMRQRAPVRQSLCLGAPHHIYSANTTALQAWTPCGAHDFPPGHWVAQPAAPGARPAPGSQLAGTLEAQRFIWAHQHPNDCGRAKFLLYRGHPSGIGSALHHMGQALALAIQLGRVLVVLPDERYPWQDAAKCGVGTSWEACYFEPLSSCSWRDAREVDSDACIASPSQVKDPAQRTVCFAGSFSAPDYHLQTVPPQFEQLLQGTPIDFSKRYYWWRAQSVAYIVRPNARTRAEVAARMRRAFLGQAIAPGTIGVHVRRGDKHLEAAPVPDEAFLQRAQELLQAQQQQQQQQTPSGRACRMPGRPGGLKGRLFLSTEDPATVEDFRGWARNNGSGWRVQIADVPRKPDTSKSTLAYAAEIGPYEEMLNSLVNLELALQCDAWVGTLSSNWCRLIDELRSTVRCKAHLPYYDAGQANPPQHLDW